MATPSPTDLGLLQRVYRTSLLVGGLVALLLCTTANGKWVVNYALGVLVSLSFIKVTELFVTQTFRAAGEVKLRRRWAVPLMVGKWAVLVAGLYFLTRLRYFDGALLAAGIATPHVVFTLKALGITLQSHQAGDRAKGRTRTRP